MGKILLFYKYITIQYPKRILKWQRKICSDLALTGRIFIGHEGINATVAGSSDAIDRYKQVMESNSLFAGIDYKESAGDSSYFPKLEIKIKKEVVNLGIDPEALTVHEGGEHLKPEQVHELLKNKPDDLVILDTRNEYEWRIGRFQDAVLPPIQNFRQFPAYVDENLDQFKDKQVLMYCTGGIRCERATAYLNQKGIAKKVFQIEGGIVRYAEKYPDGFFRGKNYVFDRRVAVPVTQDVLTVCDLCAQSCDEYTNCINASCNEHYISCASCMKQYQNCCSDACYQLVKTGQVKTRIPFEKAPTDVHSISRV